MATIQIYNLYIYSLKRTRISAIQLVVSSDFDCFLVRSFLKWNNKLKTTYDSFSKVSHNKKIIKIQ